MLIGGSVARLARSAMRTARLSEGEYDKARTKLLKAHDLDPDNPYVQNNLALLQST